MSEDKTDEELRKLLLQTHIDEFEFISNTWNQLDTKAQGLGAIAGIFIAAIFTWTRGNADNLNCFEFLSILLAVLALIATVLAAVSALQIRKTKYPPHGERSAKLIQDIRKISGPTEAGQRVRNLYIDLSKAWSETNNELRELIIQKGKFVKGGQQAVAAAAIVIGFLPLHHVFVTMTLRK